MWDLSVLLTPRPGRTRPLKKYILAVKIGNTELGNWNDRSNQGGGAIRHLSGAMDEFALWDRVLSDVEIASLTK